MELQEIITKVEKGELENMSAQELGKAFAIVASSEKPEGMTTAQYNALMNKVATAALAAKEKEQKGRESQAAEEEKLISEEQFKKNEIALNKNAEQYRMDDESKKVLGALDVKGEDGKSIDIRQEITDAAQVRVAVDNVANEKEMDTKEYNQKVHDEIMAILGTMILTTDPEQGGESLKQAELEAKSFEDLLNGKKTAVSSKRAASALATHLGTTEVRAQEVSQKHKNPSFFSRMAGKIKNIGTSLVQKVGKKAKEAQDMVRTMIEQGTWKEAVLTTAMAGVAILAAGSTAGLAASAGLAVYSAYNAGKRVKALIGNYQKERAAAEKQEKKMSFLDFAKNHKGDLIKTALYTGAAVAGVTASIAGFANMASGATEGMNMWQAAQAKMGTARLALTAGAVETPAIGDMITAKNSKEFWSAAKKGLFAGAGLIGSIWAAHEFSDVFHGGNEGAGGEGNGGEGNGNGGEGNGNGGEGNGNGGNGNGNGGNGNGNGGDGNGNGGDGNGDSVDHNYHVDAPGERESAFYEKRLSMVPHSDIMVLNAQDGLVTLPEGMTPEQAVHLAAMEKLYYGDGDGLKALLDCDEIKFDTEKYFAELHDKFVTQMGDPRGPMGYPTDPKFVGANIHAKITDVNCDDIKLNIHRGTVHVPPAEPVQVKPLDVTPVDGLPFEAPEVKVDEVVSMPDIKPTTPDINHATDPADLGRQLAGQDFNLNGVTPDNGAEPGEGWEKDAQGNWHTHAKNIHEVPTPPEGALAEPTADTTPQKESVVLKEGKDGVEVSGKNINDLLRYMAQHQGTPTK